MSKHIADGGEYFYVFDPTEVRSMWPYSVIEDIMSGKFFLVELNNGVPNIREILPLQGIIPKGNGSGTIISVEKVRELRCQ